MTDYNKRLQELSTIYKLLIDKFKKVYPLYKADSSNTEYVKMYTDVQDQIQNIYSEMESIDQQLENKVLKDDMLFNRLNNKLKETKIFYNKTKPKLKNIISKNEGAVPREEDIKQELYYKYMDFGYILILFGVMFYSYRKLLK